MKKLFIILFSFLMLSSASYGMGLNLQNEVLNILVEFEADELRVEDKYTSTELVYLNRWPAKIQNRFENYLTNADYYTHNNLASLSWSDPSGEYGVNGRIQRSLEVTIGGEKAYIAYYLFIGGEWGREEVYNHYFVLDQNGDVVMAGIFERDENHWALQDGWDID